MRNKYRYGIYSDSGGIFYILGKKRDDSHQILIERFGENYSSWFDFLYYDMEGIVSKLHINGIKYFIVREDL